MNRRSPVMTFIVFVFLFAIVLLQGLSMIQADRLYERLNTFIDQWQSSPRIVAVDRNTQASPNGNDGDWLVWHEPGEPKTLNPISIDATLEARAVVSRNVFEYLFDYDLDYQGVKLEPMLAEGMEISDDGLEITVKLKEDIWFSDGHPVTAADILFTYNTIMDPNVDAADTRNYYENVDHLEKVDEKTVKFVFKEIYWKTLESVGLFEVLPEHIYAYEDARQFNNRISNPVGSGPYVFEKWDVGQQIVLRRNENYWGKKPSIDKLVFRFITNIAAALKALEAGSIDMMEPSSEQFDEKVGDESFREDFYAVDYWAPSGGFWYIGWNSDTPYFGDSRVRLAMTHLVDRDAMVEHLLKGRGRVITGPFYIYGKQNDPNVRPWPYNPQHARELLGEAGWVDADNDGIREKDGTKLSFNITYPAGSDTAEQVIKLFKDSASQAGVDVKPDPVEWSIFVQRLHERKVTAGMSGWGGTIESDPYQLFHSSQVNGGSNYFGFRNEQADEVMEQARRTLEPEKRYELYHEFHRILHEEQPYTFMFTRPTYMFLDDRFENVTVHELGIDHREWYVPMQMQRYK